jgi:hypothetical protein
MATLTQPGAAASGGGITEVAWREFTSDWDGTVYDPGNTGNITESGTELTMTVDASTAPASADPGNACWGAIPITDIFGALVTGDDLDTIVVRLDINATRPVIADDVKLFVCLANDPDMDAATADAAVVGVEWNSGQAGPRSFSGRIVDDTYSAANNGTATATVVAAAIITFQRVGTGGATGSKYTADIQLLDASDNVITSVAIGLTNSSAATNVTNTGSGQLYLCIGSMSINAGVATPRTIKARVRFCAVSTAHG